MFAHTENLGTANSQIELLTKIVESYKKNGSPPVEKKPSIMSIDSMKAEDIKFPIIVKKQPLSKKDSGNLELMSVCDFSILNNKNQSIDRLLKSVGRVKEVLKSNLELREQIQLLTKRIEMQNAELFHLQCENNDQKSKILILSNMNTNSEQNSIGEKEANQNPKIETAEEIFKLRKDRKSVV